MQILPIKPYLIAQTNFHIHLSRKCTSTHIKPHVCLIKEKFHKERVYLADVRTQTRLIAYKLFLYRNSIVVQVEKRLWNTSKRLMQTNRAWTPTFDIICYFEFGRFIIFGTFKISKMSILIEIFDRMQIESVQIRSSLWYISLK